MKLLVGIPLFAGYESIGLASLCRCLLYTQKVYPDINIDIFTTIRELYFRAQTKIVRRAIREQFDYLFFTEEDNVLKEDTLVSLISHDLPVVSGIYVERNQLHLPCYASKDKEGRWVTRPVPDDERLFEVDVLPMGCLLLKREVFEKLGDFEFIDPEAHFPGDWSLSFQLKRLGYKLIIDRKTEVGHVGQDKPVFYLKDMKRRN